MHALVTGAGGFVGRHLVAHLRSLGDEVTTSDPASGGPDLLDGDGWRDLLRSVRPDACYHLAAQAAVGASWDDPVGTFRTNAEGTLHVLAGCAAADVHRVLVVSSADVYGAARPEDLPLSETSPLRPVTPYAASKAAAEQIALQFHHGHGLGVIRVRPFNHLGPGQDDRFVAAAIARRIAVAERRGGEEIPVGNLGARRDFSDVRDVVRAYRLAVLDGEPGAVYVVASGRSVAVSELADHLISRATTPLRLTVDPALHRPVDVADLVGDPTLLRATTGWTPDHDLGRTLDDLLEDARRWAASHGG